MSVLEEHIAKIINFSDQIEGRVVINIFLLKNTIKYIYNYCF